MVAPKARSVRWGSRSATPCSSSATAAAKPESFVRFLKITAAP
ncbi:hypothetical protein ABH931_004829 [Streptacidiphilus sp. MAP12-33]